MKPLLRNIPSPIRLFDLREFEINQKSLEVLKSGIIQLDKNAEILHSVDKIIPIGPSKPAIRATIGFNFEFIR